jgi:hypothetical protein
LRRVTSKIQESIIEKKNVSKIFKTSLVLVMIVFVFTISSPTSFFQIVKPAEAAGLTRVSVVPTTGIVNQRTTYDIFLTTATTATIRSIEISFPSSFDISDATKVIERDGIHSGSLSSSGSTLKYSIYNPVRVSAGTTIKLEIASIVAGKPGTFTASISTLKGSGQIDGPTSSSSFSIKDIDTNDIAANSVTSSKIADNSITGRDLSTGLTIRKTLNDDNAGHAHGWDPNGSTKSFAIFDSDIAGASDSEFISVMIRYANLVYCTASPGDTGLFVVHCNSAPVGSAVLDYVITKLPANVVTSTDTSALTSSSAHTSALAEIESINRQDDTASEFP